MTTLLEKPIASVTRKNLSICVVDDEPDQVELVTERLDRAGFTVSGTTKPEDALEKIRLGNCRVVLTDFKMPGMDGLAFLQKVLECDPGMNVILITGHYSIDSAIEAIRRGAYDYLCKPIDYARLENPSTSLPNPSYGARRSVGSKKSFSTRCNSRGS